MTNGSLFKRTVLRKHILDRCRTLRPAWGATRVKPEAMDVIEARVWVMIDRIVSHHPSIGQTFSEVI